MCSESAYLKRYLLSQRTVFFFIFSLPCTSLNAICAPPQGRYFLGGEGGDVSVFKPSFLGTAN